MVELSQCHLYVKGANARKDVAYTNASQVGEVGLVDVRAKELQRSLAELLGAPYFPDTYAFYAAELSDDAASVTAILGLCQFTYAPEESTILSVK